MSKNTGASFALNRAPKLNRVRALIKGLQRADLQTAFLDVFKRLIDDKEVWRRLHEPVQYSGENRMIQELLERDRLKTELLLAVEAEGTLILSENPDIPLDDVFVSSKTVQMREQAAIQYTVNAVAPFE